VRKVLGLAMVTVGCWVAAYSFAWYGDTSGAATVVARGTQPAPPDLQGAPLTSTAVPPIVQEALAETRPIDTPPFPVKPVMVFEAAPRFAVDQSSSATGPRDGATLAREIQRHLKRVGCYDGEAHGLWTPTVRRAMKAFTDHVNAALPVESPDLVLLSMVENYHRRACGTPCPVGQNPGAAGRCMPFPGPSRGADQRPVAPAVAGSIAENAKAPVSPGPGNPVALEGRMGLAGPDVPAEAIDSARKQVEDAQRSRARSARYERERRRQRGAAKQKYPAWALRAFSSGVN
jgi:hypothetical protein